MNKKIKELYLFLTLKLLFPWQYRRFRKLPLKEGKAVFIEANLTQLSGSLRFLYEVLCEKEDMEVHVQYLQESGDKLRFIRNALACLKDCADAKYIFLCEGSRVISCIEPRKETVITQLWHGCGAFKKFGFSTCEDLFGGSRKEYLKYSYYKNYNYITVSSPEVIWAYQEAMNLPKEQKSIVPVGVSCTDLLFQEKFHKAAKKKLSDHWPQAEGKKIMLYAPTFRGSVGQAKAPDALDLVQMKEKLGKEWILLIKQHPVVKQRPPVPKEAKGFAFDVSDDFVIEELLCVSDVCVSDYSSLVFEYSLFERPMVFFAYDFAEYGEWRGFYYDYQELTPGPVLQTTEEVVDYVLHLEERFDRQRVADFKQKFMSACDGHATERLLEMIQKEKTYE